MFIVTEYAALNIAATFIHIATNYSSFRHMILTDISQYVHVTRLKVNIVNFYLPT